MQAVPNPVEIDRSEYSRVFDAARMVLRDHGFELDRQDHRFGKITTKYRDAPTLFEPWSRLNTSRQRSLERTINHQRLSVAVSLEPLALPAVNPALSTHPRTPQTPDFNLRVEVFVDQRQVPDRHLTGSTTAHRVFNAASFAHDSTGPHADTAPFWRPLAQDDELEQRLIAAIVRRSVYLRHSP